MRRLFLGFFLLLLCNSGFTQSDSIIARIWLVGDAGQLKNGHNPQLETLRRLNLLDNKSTVLFLGDNIYPAGLPDSQSNDYATRKKIIDIQAELIKGTDARAYFIPGNHDWKEGRNRGWEQVQHQYQYITALDSGRRRPRE